MTQNPGIKPLDLIKMVAKHWVTVDTATKTRFEEEYRGEKVKYDVECAKYNSKLTPENKESLKQAREDRVESREKREFRRRNKELAKPKKPATSFLRFVNQEAAKHPKPNGHKAFLLEMAVKWGKMTDEQKKSYSDQFQRDMALYKLEIEKWETKMIREGNLDVVRNPLLDEPMVKTSQGRPKRSA